MKLESLQIQLEPSYSDQAGQYTGRVTFENERKGVVKLSLSPELSNRILAVVADELVATSRMVAMELTAQCIESVAALPVHETENHLLTT
jgi:hypothetical protein